MPAETSCKRELDVSVPWEQVEQEINRVVEAYRGQVRIPGFRKGKAPATVLRTRYWRDIKQEVIEKLIPQAFWEQADAKSQKVIGSPDVTELHFEEGEPLRFHAEFEVAPEFELGEYRRLEIPFQEPQVTDEDIDRELEALREEHASFRNLDPRPLEKGDIAVVSLESREGSGAPQIAEDETTIVLGDEETMPEFTENLLGKSPGDEVDFEVHYPEDFGSEKLAGKTATFHALVKGIRGKELPELDDDFAADVGKFSSLEDLRSRIREAIQNQRRRQATEAAKEKLIDALVEKHDFAVPEKLVERQVRVRAERRLRRLAEGVDISKLNLDWSKIREAEYEGAVREVKAGLLLERIAQAEKIDVTSEEIDEQIRNYASQKNEPVAAVRARLAEDGTLDRIRAHIRNEKTLNFLFDEAQKVDQEVEAG